MSRFWKVTVGVVLAVAVGVGGYFFMRGRQVFGGDLPSPPVLVLSIQSLDTLQADLSHIAARTGMAKMQQFALEIQNFAGVDMGRPVGVYVNQIPNEAENLPKAVVLFVPITKEEDFRKALKDKFEEPKRIRSGRYSMNVDGTKVILGFDGKRRYCYLALDEAVFDKEQPLDPATFAAKENKKEDKKAAIAFSIHPERLTKENQEVVLKFYEGELAKNPMFGPPMRGPAEPEEHYKARQEYMRFTLQRVKLIMQDLKEFNFYLGLDRVKNMLALETTFHPQAKDQGGQESELLSMLKKFKGVRSMFSSMGEDSVGRFYGHAPMLEGLKLDKSLPLMEDMAIKYIGDDKEKSKQQQRELAKRFFKLMRSNLETDMVDLFLLVNPPPAGKQLAIAGGIKFKHAKGLGGILSEVVAQLPKEDKAQFHLDYARHANTSIHMLELQPGSATELLYLAMTKIEDRAKDSQPKEAILFSYGARGLPVMQRCLDDLGRESTNPSPMFLEVSLVKMMLFFMEMSQNPSALAKINQMFPADDMKDRVKLTISADWAEVVTTRIAVHVDAVRLVEVLQEEGQLDVNLNPNFGSVKLEAGFEPDPFVKAVEAGGPIRTNLGGVNAYVSKAPDFKLFYTAGKFPLTILAKSGSDTTLLIRRPDGAWLADDDSGGNLNPLVRFPTPQSGRYDIYVGTLGSAAAPATLMITEGN